MWEEIRGGTPQPREELGGGGEALEEEGEEDGGEGEDEDEGGGDGGIVAGSLADGGEDDEVDEGDDGEEGGHEETESFFSDDGDDGEEGEGEESCSGQGRNVVPGNPHPGVGEDGCAEEEESEEFGVADQFAFAFEAGGKGEAGDVGEETEGER